MQRIERRQCSASLVELTAHSGFREIQVTVTARIVAFAKERGVFLGAKLFALQTVSGAEAGPQTEKETIATPILGEKIGPLMQANSGNS